MTALTLNGSTSRLVGCGLPVRGEERGAGGRSTWVQSRRQRGGPAAAAVSAMPLNKKGLAVTIATGLAVSAGSSGSMSMPVPSPLVRQGRAFSESLLGIRLHMSRWQIVRALLLSAIAVTLVAMATVRDRGGQQRLLPARMRAYPRHPARVPHPAERAPLLWRAAIAAAARCLCFFSPRAALHIAVRCLLPPTDARPSPCRSRTICRSCSKSQNFTPECQVCAALARGQCRACVPFSSRRFVRTARTKQVAVPRVLV